MIATNFHTIKSILNHAVVIGVLLLMMDFHTIKSILNLTPYYNLYPVL